MSCPDPYRPFNPSEQAPAPDADLKVQNELPTDADIRGLTNALAASGGGAASEDLALDLVLNQIVEQACLATGATGAAIALTRNGEMVCRATTGRTAPDLGVRLDNAGFSAECLRVGTLQRCDDTETDPRVDSAACRLLGVRSILVVPLWYWGEFMGILEIFSPRPEAFGERDEQTLQALAYRIVRHTKQASGHLAGFSAHPEEDEEEIEPEQKLQPPPPPRIEAKPQPAPEPIAEVIREHARAPVFEFKPKPAKNSAQSVDRWTTWLAMCAGLIACLIVGLMLWRLSSNAPQKSAAPAQTSPQPQEIDLTPVAHAAEAAPAAAPASQDPTQKPVPKPANANATSEPSQADSAADVVVSAVSKSKKEVQAPATDTSDSATPTGGLAIYDEKGKLIYGAPVHPDEPASPEKKPKPKAANQPSPYPKPSSLVVKSVAADKLTPALIDGKFVRLKPEVAESLLDNRVEPDYPDAARRAHIQGPVTLETLIAANGRVQQVTPISGNPQLAESAATAVRQWRYKPFTVDGKQVPIRTQVTVTFMLGR
jgi:TonB family protein